MSKSTTLGVDGGGGRWRLLKGLYSFRRHAKQYIRKRSGNIIPLLQHSVKTEDVMGVVVGEGFWWRRAHSGGEIISLVDQVCG